MSPYSILSVMKDISGSVLLEVFGWERTQVKHAHSRSRRAFSGVFDTWEVLRGVVWGDCGPFYGNFRRRFNQAVSRRMSPSRG